MSKWVMAIVFAVSLIAPGSVSLGRAGEETARSADKRERDLGTELGLCEEKGAELKEQMRQMRAQMVELKEKYDDARAELNRLLDADPMDEAEIWRAVEKMHGISGEMLNARISTRLAVNKKLTVEQRQRMNELRREMHQRRRDRLRRSRRLSPENRNKTGARRNEEISE